VEAARLGVVECGLRFVEEERGLMLKVGLEAEWAKKHDDA
jgi:hypothetical protein